MFARETRRAAFRAQPERAAGVCLQRQDAARRQTGGVNGLRAPPVVTRQSAVRTKPQRAVRRLRDGFSRGLRANRETASPRPIGAGC